MKRILFAAGLIAVSPAPALPGPIHDKLDICDMEALVTAQKCIDASSTQSGEIACKASGRAAAHACSIAANAAFDANPQDW